MRGEINARDVIIARLEAEPNNLIPGLKENNDAIANLELKLSGVISELKDQETLITELGDELSKANLKLEAKDRAISAIKSGLAVKGGDKQLPLFPPELTPIQTPEPEPTPIPTPEPTPEPETIPTPKPTPEPKSKAKTTPEPEPTPETLTRGELLKYILEKFPDSGMEDHNIGDAVAGKTKRLSEFESAYGFKYLGKIKGKNRFQLNSNP